MADKVTFAFNSAFVDVTYKGTPIAAGAESTVEVGQKVKIEAKSGCTIKTVTGASVSGALYKCDAKDVNIDAERNAATPPLRAPAVDEMVLKSPQFWHHIKNINNMN